MPRRRSPAPARRRPQGSGRGNGGPGLSDPADPPGSRPVGGAGGPIPRVRGHGPGGPWGRLCTASLSPFPASAAAARRVAGGGKRLRLSVSTDPLFRFPTCPMPRRRSPAPARRRPQGSGRGNGGPGLSDPADPPGSRPVGGAGGPIPRVRGHGPGGPWGRLCTASLSPFPASAAGARRVAGGETGGRRGGSPLPSRRAAAGAAAGRTLTGLPCSPAGVGPT